MKVQYYEADWCQPCKQMRPIVERYCEDNHIPFEALDGMTHFARLNPPVESFPTIAVFNSRGTEVLRIPGAVPKSEFARLMRQVVD